MFIMTKKVYRNGPRYSYLIHSLSFDLAPSLTFLYKFCVMRSYKLVLNWTCSRQLQLNPFVRKYFIWKYLNWARVSYNDKLQISRERKVLLFRPKLIKNVTNFVNPVTTNVKCLSLSILKLVLLRTYFN